MKIQLTKNGQYVLTIPIDIVRGFDWRKGKELDFKIVGKGKLLALERND